MLTTVMLCCVVLSTNAAIISVNEEQQASIQLEIIEWDIEFDICENIQTSNWHFLMKDTEGYLDNKVDALCQAAGLRQHAAKLATPYLEMDYRSLELGRRAQILSRPGHVMLPEKDFKKSTEFTTHSELKQRSPLGFLSYGPEQLDNVLLSEVPNLLSTLRNATQLESIWRAWQRTQTPSDLEAWTQFLSFNTQAASLNGASSVSEYWELLSDWNNGYYEAKQLWREIEPLYKKFQGFVKRRLQAKYSNVPDLIPVHLLGSPLGYDWSYIADIILPEPEVYKQLQDALIQHNLGGENAYKKAEELGINLGLAELGNSFYEDSVFNGSCPANLVPSCADESAKVFTCDAAGWQEYLDAHENVFRAYHHNLASADNTFIFKHGERISGISEATAGLASLLATANVLESGLLERDVSDSLGQQLNLRLLVALRVLPRLSALLAVDLCRIREASSPSTSPRLCWYNRRDFQKISTPSKIEDDVWWDILADPAVTSNTPHLSEFAGLILQFQFLDHMTQGANIFNANIMKKTKFDDDLRGLLSKGLKAEWPKLLEDFKIQNINTASLLKYFEPLIPIFDDMSPVSEIPEIPDYEISDLIPPPSVDKILTNDTSVETFDNSTLINEDIIETGTTLPMDNTESEGTSQKTTFIAIAGIILGVSIVVASVFLVNKRKKSKIIRHGNQYEAVMRHSAGRPASFSPVVAKRLSENGECPSIPKFSTFREIDLENNIPEIDDEDIEKIAENGT